MAVADRLAHEAAEVIAATAGRRARPSTKKSPFDWVTDTDRELERHTRDVLAAAFPTIPLVGEEFGLCPVAGGTDGTGLRWVVDPVDGTANYVAGLPWCAYSLALVDGGGPLVGVVADPDRGMVYLAARHRGASANGGALQRLQPLATAAGSLVCTENWTGLGSFSRQAHAAHTGMRVLGSAALAIVQVALGHTAAAVLNRYSVWDVAGALALASETGAVVLDRDGGRCALPTDGLLVAAPGGVAQEVFGWWQRAQAGQDPTEQSPTERKAGDCAPSDAPRSGSE